MTSPILSVRERFYQKVGPPTHTGCREWQGATDPSGYGRVTIAGKKEQAHRVAWEFDHGGPVPLGLLVRHICHNKLCVAAVHLLTGTRRDNTLDTIRAGRDNIPRGADHYNSQKTHCLRGHPYDEANTYRPPGGRFRACRTCVAANAKRRYQAGRNFSRPILGQTYLGIATAIMARY